METAVARQTDELDELDRKILQALQINGRASFSAIGAVVGASEQTVARRYQRLRTAGIVRVVGLVDAGRLGQLDWMIRIACRPNAATSLAAALAQRVDVSWVTLTGAGNEIVASLRARTPDARDDLLLRRLPKTEQVLNLSVGVVMHRFTGHYEADWRVYPAGLGPDAADRLGATRPVAESSGVAVEPLDPDDHLLLTALAADGRTPVPALARLTGWSATRVRRRLDQLLTSGMLYLDVDLSLAALGFPLLAMLWMTVEPKYLDRFGNALVKQSAITFAGATTGASNLYAAAALSGVDSLYQFVNRVGELAPGLRQLEVAPVIRRIKQAGSLIDGNRLVEPPSPASTSRP